MKLRAVSILSVLLALLAGHRLHPVSADEPASGKLRVATGTAQVARHNTIVFKEPRKYGGWPANHGIWSWGDELVVGFTVADFKSSKTDHSVDRSRPFAKMQARSFDGGETWTVEKPLKVDPESGPAKTSRLERPLDFTAPGFALMFDFGHLHTGPSYFYASSDRCQTWQGPYKFDVPGVDKIAARTDYLVLGKRQCLMLGSAAKADGREGQPFCAETTDGGLSWKLLSKIGDEPAGYAIMPSTVQLPGGDLYTTIRHWDPKQHGSIDAYLSADGGRHWQLLGEAAPHIGGGNPPSLIKLRDGRLCLTYGYRAKPFGIRARLSDDQGTSWGPEIILRDEAPSGDLGYPRSVQRPDGQVLTVYYYNGPRDEDRAIEATIWQPTPTAIGSPLAGSKPGPQAGPRSAAGPAVFDRVRFLPARDRAKEMVGGRFQGSNVSPESGYVTLAVIKSSPAQNTWTEISFPNDQPYRWIRYEAPAGSHGEVAEIAFFAGRTRLGGVGFGSDFTGAWKGAVDNKPDSVFRSNETDSIYVGLDLRERAATAPVALVPGPHDLPKPLAVTMKCSTPSAIIRYTLDGTRPGPDEGRLYTKPITIDKTTTVVAVAFSPDLAPSMPSFGTYLLGKAVSQDNIFSIGNSLTGNAGRIWLYARTAGRVETYSAFLIGGSLTVQLWKAKEGYDKQRWDETWSRVKLPLDFFTVQPRDFNVDDEVEYEIKFFDQIRATSANVQPWIYAEWVEMNRGRPSDKGEVPTWQMTKTVPALTWEESMSAMLLYVEEVQHRVLKTYRGPKRPRIIPVSLAMGRVRDLIDRGALPGIEPGEASFYRTLFADQVHVNENGSYLVDLMWYAAMYGESPVGKVLPINTTLDVTQARRLQELAWDIVQNYPDCGVYREGSEPVGKPAIKPEPTSSESAAKPGGGVMQVRFSSPTPGAWFRYTLDGTTTPTRTRGYVACGKVSVRPGTTVKVIAYKSGMTDSEVLTANIGNSGQ